MHRDSGLPELVQRRSHHTEEAARDRAFLEWIVRFRFVEADVLAMRFDVSRQQVNARLRRLESAGLVIRRAERTSAPWTIAVSRKGMQALGLPAERAAQTTLQRDHELNLAHMVARHERATDPRAMRTERQSRRLERLTKTRYSADTTDPKQGQARRWPGLVLEDDTRRIAIELELTPKGASRIERILAGYRRATWFDEVRFLTPDPAIHQLLDRIANDPSRARARALFPGPSKQPTIRILAWKPYELGD